ncbi:MULTISPECIES: C40 family peptidase [Thermomonosporaceae]|uniref:C40 family peptidase n=1 Tax=Thermomonosporaceae TaxID=2012 RepID=UPI00255AA341|nr:MULTISPECIES: C40 family peptidase [Thermomonosporaceae]MDL4771192.1 C40 family peptidase [Actinomadura xylanilytica]
MGRGTSRRLAATACLTVAVSITAPAVTAHAAPKPSASEVRKKLTKLNEQVDQLVEKYNQVDEQFKVAKKKLKAAKKAGAAERKSFDEQRRKIAAMAATAYKAGDSGDLPGFIGSENPQAVLDQTAVLTQLSQNRSSELTQFLAATQRLRREEAQAQATYNEVAGKAKELKAQKAKVDKSVNAQKKMLAKLGQSTGSTGGGGGGGTGGSYTGPASGSARTALNFAYAQLGKPYSYGATGPSSFDCSGLTMRAWEAAGVGITRTTNSQFAATKRVDKSALQPGDLVFFSSLGHVGMYVGGGKMIHAPRTGKNVEIVDIGSGYYASNYYGSGRP